MDDMQELSIHIKILYYIVTRTSIHFERRSTNTVVYAERSVAVARYPPVIYCRAIKTRVAHPKICRFAINNIYYQD